jgi:hypothetical protein
LVVPQTPACFYRNQAAPHQCSDARNPAVVVRDIGQLMVIEPGASNAFVIPHKAERMDKVQSRTRICA